MNRQASSVAGMSKTRRRALGALLAGAALLAPPCMDARAADASSFDTGALAHQTQRLLNDAGQVYLVWWIPPVLFQALMRDPAGAKPADTEPMLRALDPYIVFALARGQEGATRLEDVHDRADLLAHSRLTVDGQPMAAAGEQIDPAAVAALAALRPILESMLGRDGHGVEFALYRYAPGMHALDPTMNGSMEYALYRKRFQWRLPVWDSLTGAPPSAPARATPIPVPASPMAVPPAPVAGTPPSAPAPIPAQRRKIDPTSGEEFPERYNYNPYTGQKLVSQ